MPTFRCKLATSGGRIIEKTLISENKDVLKEHLEGEGYFVLDIRRTEKRFLYPKWGSGRRRFKTRDFLMFNREFSVLLKAGMPILSALDAIIAKTNEGELLDILKEIRNSVSSGEALSEAFARFSHVFSNLYVASLQAGEKSANIPLALSRHIDYLKRAAEIKQKVVSASVYPLILTGASFFAVLFLLLYVVPSFTNTYFEAGTQLPAITLALVNIANGIKSNIFFLLAIALVVMAGFLYGKRTDEARMRYDRYKLNIPFLGRLYLHYSISKLARTLSTILRGGVPLLDSVRIASGALNNQYLKKELKKVNERLEQGEGFSESLSRSTAFPPLVIRMVNAGESGGSLEEVLEDMAEFYESDVEGRLAILTSSIEPALMIIMGLLIGFIVLAMYMPIFQMASTIS